MYGCMLCNDVTTNKGWAALSFPACSCDYFMWNCTWQSCQLLHHEHSTFTFQYSNTGANDLHQTRWALSPSKCRKKRGIKRYYVPQSYVLKARKSLSPCNINALLFFTPCGVLYSIVWLEQANSSSSKSGNQHHGELLSRKENLLTACGANILKTWAEY